MFAAMRTFMSLIQLARVFSRWLFAKLQIQVLSLIELIYDNFLQAYAQQNTESVGTLLIEFFRYFCWDFDIRHSVVSIRQPKGLSKVDKAEQDGWLQSDILAYGI